MTKLCLHLEDEVSRYSTSASSHCTGSDHTPGLKITYRVGHCEPDWAEAEPDWLDVAVLLEAPVPVP